MTAVAWGLSAVLHGGLLTASYFVTWSPASVSNPEVSFARGDQATRIQFLLVPWPDPAEEKRTKEENVETSKRRNAESSTVIVSAERVDAVDPPEDVAPESFLDPPATASEDRNPLADDVPTATDVVEVQVLEHVRDIRPTDDAIEATPRTQPIEGFLDHLLDRLERFIASPETNEQVDRRKPLVAEAVEEVAAPPSEEEVRSDASSSQTAGVETGVETLDLPTPKYPLLSRRRNEEGLVLLQVEVLPDGNVGTVTVLRDAGFSRLTAAAIAAARQGRFQPATRDGHPVRATVRIPFRFVLR